MGQRGGACVLDLLVRLIGLYQFKPMVLDAAHSLTDRIPSSLKISTVVSADFCLRGVDIDHLIASRTLGCIGTPIRYAHQIV
jgi:hypothetical protein